MLHSAIDWIVAIKNVVSSINAVVSVARGLRRRWEWIRAFGEPPINTVKVFALDRREGEKKWWGGGLRRIPDPNPGKFRAFDAVGCYRSLSYCS